ncbi:hypothetical protein [Aquipuribacter sp. MA13-6]|uniref:hypothetical protein n=1 Tax=unclassified Aquipuribacter TaxID=2635084 RepID=UPI003EE8EE04
MSATVQAPVRAPVPVGALTVGTLLVLAGLVWLGEESGLVDVSWPVAIALAVGAVGVLLILTARSPHAGGLVPVGIVLLVLLVLTSVVPGVPLADGAGDRTYRPTTAAELEREYELGAGSLVLDLRELPPDATSPGTTEVTVGLGEITVLLPDDLAVDVTASARTGEVDVLGTREQGTSPQVTEVVGPGLDPLVLLLHVGLGTVEVTR